MHNEVIRENKDVIVERLNRFRSQIEGIKGGERIFALYPPAEDYVEITPNVIVRYQWMIELCEFTLQLLDSFAQANLDMGPLPIDLRKEKR
ncbi:hypothetical protein PH552_05790 [Rhizobium sp. CNPSo 3968]|uniref:hypothetical protein n=1 Tax=Rhizobium sp. CNPSo 3968 TaxID=3021408 RepID=UPI00254F5328|nr:hypothetical protein [Rhizobium sp. CNPSo 3968]MDK4718856.1 hypothetical protein [Rhizobium sp. CNPSo 3968]